MNTFHSNRFGDVRWKEQGFNPPFSWDDIKRATRRYNLDGTYDDFLPCPASSDWEVDYEDGYGMDMVSLLGVNTLRKSVQDLRTKDFFEWLYNAAGREMGFVK